MNAFNHLNLAWIEELYQKYQSDPASVESSWRYFFEGMEWGSQVIPSVPSEGSPDLKVHRLIDAYRSFGHLVARCNPIATKAPEEPLELKLENLGFSSQDLTAEFPTCGFLPEKQAPLKTLIEALRATYCKNIGIEYMGLGHPAMEKWLQQRIEPFFPLHMSREDKVWILDMLNKAEFFESFLHTKYVGQKRFSIEGGETFIPLISALIEKGSELGITEAFLGMAHRGRLNVLANILNKSYAAIFHEFEAHYEPHDFEGTGDVKYHKGFVGALNTRKGQPVTVTLVANPSHLESVDPVVEGITRARQQLKGSKEQRKEVLPILIHGDSAIAGQGVVYETMQLAQLNGYATGGTVHIIINNHIGFTTLPQDYQSTRYCSDISHIFGSPVFHVNAEDPETCVRAAQLAIELRQIFQCDVFIDLNCYRKYGHNESDEPTFTQPLEYSIIKNKRSIRDIFKERLIQEKILDSTQSEQLENAFKEKLQEALKSLPGYSSPPAKQEYIPKEPRPSSIKTHVAAQQLIELATLFCSVPADFKIHPKIAKLLQDRLAMVHGKPDEAKIDWGMGEHLAFASLLVEGIHVRLSGEDVRRGTFSHRHAIWVDQVKEGRYYPLSHLSKTQAPFDVFNSNLSEFAVLGFDFGYSVAYPKSLVIWEAQFGDFANGAQIIIDQFIASSEQKWNLTSNLTLMLPHGYEGQGPDHSSARIERFLQLSGQENMRIANCSTPASLFHLLRAQALLPIKKPLILFTPKALLRHPACVSSLNELSQGSFQEVLDDPSSPSSPKRLLFCSGKVYYDLLLKRDADTAIIRLEQLHPFPKELIASILSKYSNVQEVFWVQEEHQNMGPWEYIAPHFNELLGSKTSLKYIGRDRSASPAAGSYVLHKKQLEEIMQRAFQGKP